MILLPLASDELALVQRALRALVIFGNDRDMRMNIEESIKRCYVYPDSVADVVFSMAHK